MSPRGIDMSFVTDFSLDAEEPADEPMLIEQEAMDDPVSRVNSPAHKMARLEGAMGTSEAENALSKVAMTADVVAPETPRTPRAEETPVPGTPRTPKSRTARRSFTP